MSKPLAAVRKKRLFTFNRKVFAFPYMLVLLLFVVVPTAMLLVNAFLYDGKGSFENFALFFQAGIFLEILGNSLLVGLLVTIICLLIGFPVAYMLSRFKNGGTIAMVFVIPMWINFLIKTRAIASIFEWMGLRLGIGSVIVGMVYIFLPFMILPIHTTLANIDKSYLEAARDLGASNAEVLVKVVMPLSLPGVISGITMVFIPTISSFAITTYLGGGAVELFGDVIYNAYNLDLYGVGSVMSIIMLVFVLIASFAVNKFGDSKQGSSLI